MATMSDYKYAREFRDTIKKIARKVVKDTVPSVKMGQVYSVDAGRGVAWILFPGQTVDNLVKVKCATDKIPNTRMIDRFETDGYDAPADIVRVWGPPGDLFVLDFYVGSPQATSLQKAAGVFFTPEQFDSVSDGIANDIVPLQNAYRAAFDSGGGVVFLAKRYGWTGDLLHYGGISVWGPGCPKRTIAGLDVPDIEAGLIALDGTARYRYGQQTDGSGSANDNPGSLMNLIINGAFVGGEGAELLLMECIDGKIDGCTIYNSAGNGVEYGGAQNSSINGCYIGLCPNGTAVSVYHTTGQGSGMVTMNDCYVATSKLLLRIDGDPLNFWPHQTAFNDTLFENYVGGNDLVEINDGISSTFSRCTFTNSNSDDPTPNDCLVKITGTTHPTVSTVVVYDSCEFDGGNPTPDTYCGIRVDTTGGIASRVHFSGYTRFNGFSDVCVRVDGTEPPIINVEGSDYRGGQIPWFETGPGASLATTYSRRHVPTRWELVFGSTMPLANVFRRFGETQDRHRVDIDGMHIWMNGVDNVSKGLLRRNDDDPAEPFMSLSGTEPWQVVGGWMERILTTFVSTVAQVCTYSAFQSPVRALQFNTNGATAVVTLNDGYTGSKFTFFVSNVGHTGNTITWPANFHFVGTTPQPNGDFLMVTMRKYGTDWWQDRTPLDSEQIDDRVKDLIQNGTNLTWTYNDPANTLTGNVPDSSTTVKGAIETATDAEVIAGLSAVLASPPSGVAAAIAAAFAGLNFMVYRGVIDCSANLNYPAADAGDVYIANPGGKIGGAAGEDVDAGDMIICKVDGTLAGDQATRGANWNIIQTNIKGAVTGPTVAVSGNFVRFNGVTGKVVDDSGISADRLKVQGSTATAIGTAAKVSTIAGYTPTTGDVLYLKLDNGNTAGSPTLNINGGGAKAIFLGGFAMTATSGVTLPNGIWSLHYDGTQWHIAGTPANYDIRTQAQMEAGTLGTVGWMSALLVKQAIHALATKKVITGTISTAVGTAAKTVTLSGYTLQAGDVFALTVTSGNTAAVPTLNVNGTGALTVNQGSVIGGFNTAAAKVWLLYYTGADFILISGNDILPGVIDIDVSLAANSDSKVPSQKAVKTFVEAVELTGAGAPASTPAAGTLYRDSSVTNGAALWIYNPFVPAGSFLWEVIGGDTAWRRIASWTAGAQDGTNQIGTIDTAKYSLTGTGYLDIRRVNNVTMLRTSGGGNYLSTLTTASNPLFTTAVWPGGFHFDVSGKFAPLSILSLATAYARRTTTVDTFGFHTPVAADNIRAAYCEWIITAVWPTALPGLAV